MTEPLYTCIAWDPNYTHGELGLNFNHFGTYISFTAVYSTFDALTLGFLGSLDSQVVCSGVSDKFVLSGSFPTALLISTKTFCRSRSKIGCVEGDKTGLLA
jgi:hypothetical protein